MLVCNAPTTWRPECLQQHVFLITYSATHIDRLAKDYEWKWTNCVWLRPGRKNANGNKFTRRFPRSTLSHHWGKKGKKPVASYLEAEGTDQFFILRWSTWALPHHFPSPRNDGNAWWLLDYYRKQENSLTWCVLLLWFVDIFKLIHYSIYGESPENVRVIGLTPYLAGGFHTIIHSEWRKVIVAYPEWHTCCWRRSMVWKRNSAEDGSVVVYIIWWRVAMFCFVTSSYRSDLLNYEQRGTVWFTTVLTVSSQHTIRCDV